MLTAMLGRSNRDRVTALALVPVVVLAGILAYAALDRLLKRLRDAGPVLGIGGAPGGTRTHDL